MRHTRARVYKSLHKNYSLVCCHQVKEKSRQSAEIVTFLSLVPTRWERLVWGLPLVMLAFGSNLTLANSHPLLHRLEVENSNSYIIDINNNTGWSRMKSRGCLTEISRKEGSVHHWEKLTCMMKRKQTLIAKHQYGNIQTTKNGTETQQDLSLRDLPSALSVGSLLPFTSTCNNPKSFHKY